jgi:RND family efflux transporter MFP subunit
VSPLLLLGSCSVLTQPNQRHDGESATAPSQPSPIAGVADVEIFIVASDVIIEPVRASGFVDFDRKIPLSFNMGGIVKRMTVDEGVTVKAGQIVAALQPDSVAAVSGAAVVDVQVARRRLNRLEALAKKGFATPAQVDEARQTVSRADAQRIQALYITTNASLRAPVSGLILRRLAEPGQVVQSGTPVFEIGDERSGLVARVSFPSRTLLEIGTPISLRSDELPNRVYAGRVVAIRPERSRETGTLDVKIGLSDPIGLKLGMIVDATAGLRSGALDARYKRIPAAALVDGWADQGTIYIVDAKNVARERKIVIEGIDNGGLVTSGGVVAGDRVIVGGGAYVRDGVTIRPRKL